jgi:hypothetical protein
MIFDIRWETPEAVRSGGNLAHLQTWICRIGDIEAGIGGIAQDASGGV